MTTETNRREPRRTTIALASIAYEAESNTGGAEPLDPGGYIPGEILVDTADPSHRSGVGIVDGFHRLAGIAAWARAEGCDFAAVRVPVIDCAGADEDLVGRAADGGHEGQQDAIDELIGLVA